MWLEWGVVGSVIVIVAFVLRVGVHTGREPGGVDTWYYLAYADAVRRRPGFDVRLPQYLLQDERQSAPPLFPMLLALLPRSWLRRWFWAISPLIDCVHLVVLYWLVFKITRSLPVAMAAAAIYACTPHLIAETRSLSARSFGALAHSTAMVMALRYVVFSDPWPWLGLALITGAVVFLASGSSATAYAFVSVVLALVYADLRYVVVCGGAAVVATALSGGHFLRVLRNYLHAVEYWRRNRSMVGAHAVRHSPVYGHDRVTERPPGMPGFLGRGFLPRLVRLVGENPFILALPFVSAAVPPWGSGLYWWAVALTALSVLATVVPPLSAFGPGRVYIKTAVFPTAYTLGVAIGSLQGFPRPIGIVPLVCLAASLAAIAFFWVYSHRQATERTASVPPGLARAVEHLSRARGDGVLVLPNMYADYVAYNAGKQVLWGGHCGDLRRLEDIAPVLTRRAEDLLAAYGARYVLLDALFVRPEEMDLEKHFTAAGAWDSFLLFELTNAA